MGRRQQREIITILWRDIPAQVNGRDGEQKHSAILPHRFQKAIDRAAMVAGKKTAQEYVAEMRRTTAPLEGDLAATVDRIAAGIEAEFTNDRLQALIDNGGWASPAPDAASGTAPDASIDASPEEGTPA